MSILDGRVVGSNPSPANVPVAYDESEARKRYFRRYATVVSVSAGPPDRFGPPM
jgi:hypothetical protein